MYKPKILVIGDACVDHYVFGQCVKLNPESAAPLLSWSQSEQKYGMALNVKANLEALGCEVNAIVPENLSVKTRFIDIRNGQQLLRLDQDQLSDPVDIELEQLVNYDCIVISDYGKGFISEDLLLKIDRARVCPVFVDTKKTSLRHYRHSIFKINQLEYRKLQSYPENLIVTEGDQGARYQGRKFATEKATVVDVCGAGDMFLSALAYHYTRSKVPLLSYSIEFANHAAKIAVQHQGVYVLNENDVRQLMTKYEEFPN